MVDVHFVLSEEFITKSTINIRMMDMNRVYLEETVPVELIHALPASKVKTITYPGRVNSLDQNFCQYQKQLLSVTRSWPKISISLLTTLK